MIKDIELRYYRHACAKVENGKCDNCGKETIPILKVDTSDDEYGAIHLCKECINNEFKNGE